MSSFFSSLSLHSYFKLASPGLPWWSSGKNQPANVGDTGSIPGLRRFHMTQGNKPCVPKLPSLCSTTREATREATTMRGPLTAMKTSPCQLEKALAQQQRPNTAHPPKKSPYLKLQLLLTLMTFKTVTQTLFLNCRCHLTNLQSLLKSVKHVECNTCETELAIFIFSVFSFIFPHYLRFTDIRKAIYKTTKKLLVRF